MAASSAAACAAASGAAGVGYLLKDRIGDIVNGVVKRVEYGSVIVDLGRGEAIVRRDELIPRELFRNGDRVRAYLFDVRREQPSLGAGDEVEWLDAPDGVLALVRRGEDGARIFGAAPGRFGAGVADKALDTDWQERATLGETYLASASHAYGGPAAAPLPSAAFGARVAAADAFVHVSDTPGRDILEAASAADLPAPAPAPAADETPAEPQAKPIAAGVRIGHVHLKVADLDRALAFYRDVLGLTVNTDVSNDGFRWLTLTTPNQPELEITLQQPDGMPYSDEDKRAIAEMTAKTNCDASTGSGSASVTRFT